MKFDTFTSHVLTQAELVGTSYFRIHQVVDLYGFQTATGGKVAMLLGTTNMLWAAQE